MQSAECKIATYLVGKGKHYPPYIHSAIHDAVNSWCKPIHAEGNSLATYPTTTHIFNIVGAAIGRPFYIIKSPPPFQMTDFNIKYLYQNMIIRNCDTRTTAIRAMG